MDADNPRSVEHVAVLDGRAAGAGIAQVLAVAGYGVTLYSGAATLEAVRAEVDEGRFGLRAAADTGRLSGSERLAALDRLAFTAERDEALASADLVILADPPPIAALRALLAQIEEVVAAGTVVACNSEGDPIGAMAMALRRPDRLIGWRWGRPTSTNKTAEIVRCPQTSPGTVDTVVHVARRVGKNPVVVADAPAAWGYVTNRIWEAARAEAARIVSEEVATAEQVDQLVVDCFGWPSGPFGRGA